MDQVLEFLDKKINNPTIVHFGKLDKGIKRKSFDVKKYSQEQKFKVSVLEYDNADHGFNCEDRKSYNKEASKSALKRSLKFIDENND